MERWTEGESDREVEAERQCDRDFSRAFLVSIGTLREYLFWKVSASKDKNYGNWGTSRRNYRDSELIPRGQGHYLRSQVLSPFSPENKIFEIAIAKENSRY